MGWGWGLYEGGMYDGRRFDEGWCISLLLRKLSSASLNCIFGRMFVVAPGISVERLFGYPNELEPLSNLRLPRKLHRVSLKSYLGGQCASFGVSI